MVYPCIVYKRENIDFKYANDKSYCNMVKYSVTVIDKNPNSQLVDQILNLPLCSFDRHFTKDNLNHDVYKLFY